MEDKDKIHDDQLFEDVKAQPLKVKKKPLKQRLMQPDSKIEISVPTLLAMLAFVGVVAASTAIGWVIYHTYMAYKLYLGF